MEKYENLTTVIADNLIYYRKKAQLTQSELAEKINYSDKSVSKWERGEGVPDIYVLVELAKLYGLNVDDFLTSKKKQKVANMFLSKFLITLISIALVWFVFTFIFICLKIFAGKYEESFPYWLLFIYAIPVSCVVWIVFNDVFFKRIYNIISVSVLCWSIALSLYLSLMDVVEKFELIFVIAVPFQVMIVLFYTLLLGKKKKQKE